MNRLLENFINHKNNDGMDALDIALNSGNEKAIEVLRSYGADIKNKADGSTQKITAKKTSIVFLIIVRTGHRKAESTARRKDSNRGMFFLALFFIANQ